MQRSLERVRRCDDMSPEAALLLEELGRQLQELLEGGGRLTDRLHAAAQQVESVHGQPAP